MYRQITKSLVGKTGPRLFADSFIGPGFLDSQCSEVHMHTHLGCCSQGAWGWGRITETPNTSFVPSLTIYDSEAYCLVCWQQGRLPLLPSPQCLSQAGLVEHSEEEAGVNSRAEDDGTVIPERDRTISGFVGRQEQSRGICKGVIHRSRALVQP